MDKVNKEDNQMIKPIVTIAVIVCIFIVEHLFSFIVKKSRKLLYIYSTTWLIIYLGLFAYTFQISFSVPVRVFVLLVLAGLGIRSAMVYHTPMYATKENKFYKRRTTK